MSLAFLDAAALARRVSIEDAIDALETAFAKAQPDTPLRTHLKVGEGELLLMPAEGRPGVGVKLVTLNAANPGRGLPLVHAVYILFSPETLVPAAVIDGAALTALRTSAVSALATRHLARDDVSRLVIFGAGVQGTAHLDAMRAVRPIRWVRVVSRSREAAERLAARAADAGLEAGVADPEVVREAELICTCTTSEDPVFPGALLAPGTHINAVGAYRPDMRELDDEAVRRSVIVVETREAALAEAGDLLQAMGNGVIDEAAVAADLSEVVRGARVRGSDEDITLFKSVGVAFEDLAVAGVAVGGGAA